MVDASEKSETFKLTLTGRGLNLDTQVDADIAAQITALAVGGASPTTRTTQRRAPRGGRRGGGKKTGGGGKSKRRRGSPGIVRDLSLRPSGKKPFAEFAAEKKPRSHPEKQAVIVHWLRYEAGVAQGITIDHVNTCYQGAQWRRPGNLENSLQQTANRKGWLDTSNSEDIALTVPGEDFVTHELPRDSK